MKRNKETQEKLGRQEFNSFHKAVLTIGMGFSDRYNSMHSITSAAVLLATMCKNGMCAEQASDLLHVKGTNSPGSDWLLAKLDAIKYDTMHENARHALRRTVRDAMNNGILQQHELVAIDKTKIYRYDKNPNMKYLIKTKGKGTNTAEAYMTARTVGTNEQFHLACIPVTRDEFNPYFVRKILDEMRRLQVRPRLLMMDREFFAVDVMRTISRAGLRFLIPAVSTPGIKKAIAEFEDDKREEISEYTVHAQNGDKFSCTLVIVPKKKPSRNGKHIGFVTNMAGCKPEDLMELPEEYRKRWGIETGYKDAKRIMPRTTSRNDAIRLVLFFLSLVMSNIWMYARANSPDTVKFVVLLARMIKYVTDEILPNHSDPG